MSITNKLSIFAENATINNEDYTTTTTGLVYSDDAWKNVDIRNSGESTGIASSRRFNTALRQATFGSKLLGDILETRYSDILHSDISCDNISNVISDIQEIMSPGQQFLRPDDVYTSTIQDGAVTTAKLSASAKCPYAGTADKAISDNNGANIRENYLKQVGFGSNYITFAIGTSVYMIQWGMCIDTTTEGTISPPNPYENLDYSIILTGINTTGGGFSNTTLLVTGVQRSSFTYVKGAANMKFHWLTIGQA